MTTDTSTIHPTEIGPYIIKEHLASGGMAEVYLAIYTNELGISREVVLKCVCSDLNDSSDFLAMFFDEARLLMNLSYPHIAQVFDAGVINSYFYIVMEYIPGITLTTLLRTHRDQKIQVPIGVGVTIGVALSQALSYVHQRRGLDGEWLSIIHRDLKPSNVLISSDGVVKLIDFGIAQAASKRHKTKTGLLKGTLGYLAPEQIMNQAVDQRADVFTLGLILYQLFIGKYPFSGKTEAQRLKKIIGGIATNPLELRPDCPTLLADLLTTCLRANPSERPSMTEITDTLMRTALEHNALPSFSDLSRWLRALSLNLPNQSETFLSKGNSSFKSLFNENKKSHSSTLDDEMDNLPTRVSTPSFEIEDSPNHTSLNVRTKDENIPNQAILDDRENLPQHQINHSTPSEPTNAKLNPINSVSYEQSSASNTSPSSPQNPSQSTFVPTGISEDSALSELDQLKRAQLHSIDQPTQFIHRKKTSLWKSYTLPFFVIVGLILLALFIKSL